MNIFITGVAGFLGANLAEVLLKSGHTVRGIDNLIGGDLENVPKGVFFTEGDCSDVNLLKSLLLDIDVVYHFACFPHEGLSVFSPALITTSVFNPTAAILSASISMGVKKFVYASSMARYGNQPIFPFYEEMSCFPVDPYGIAKLSSEMLIKNLCDLHGMDYVITVPHNIIGEKQKYDDPFRNVVSIMINRILQGKAPIIYGDGFQQRSFSDVRDVVSCYELILHNKEANGQIINIGPDDNYITMNELVEQIYKVLCIKKITPQYVEARPLEVKKAACSASKARRILNYEPSYSLSDSILSIYKYIEKRGVKPFQYHLPVEIVNKYTPLTWLDERMNKI